MRLRLAALAVLATGLASGQLIIRAGGGGGSGTNGTDGQVLTSNGATGFGTPITLNGAYVTGLFTGTCPSGTTSVLGTNGANQCITPFPNANAHGSILGVASASTSSLTQLIYPFGFVNNQTASCGSISTGYYWLAPIGGWLRNATLNISAAMGKSPMYAQFVPNCATVGSFSFFAGGATVPPSGAAGGYLDSWSTVNSDAKHVNQYETISAAMFRGVGTALVYSMGTEFISDDGTADSILSGVHDDTLTASSTQFIGPLYFLGATEAAVAMPIPFAGTLKNLMFANNVSPTANATVTVRKGSGSGAASDTTLTSTITAADAIPGYYQDTTHTVAVSAGDFISFKTVSGASTQAQLKAESVVLVPGDGQSIWIGGALNNSTVGATTNYATPFSLSVGTTLAAQQFTMPISCTASHLYVYQQTANGGGVTTTFTLYASATGSVTPTATALTGTITNGSGTGAIAVDTTHTVALTAGGNITLAFVAAGGTDGAKTSWAMACQ